ncbi:MAG: alpha/beta fold hydrolase [Betaproteobacteria bacterium]|nr:MAG: alpha/beta fold hydrolase [Betaproteobacteria bacterium]
MKTKTHSIPGLVLNAHCFDVPVNYEDPIGETIKVFAREVIAPGKESSALPYLVFFQGGPGSGSPRPSGNSGWLKRALQEFRVLLLDQRGTGLSTPITSQTMQRFATPMAQAQYIQHFRADNIVRDAEFIRKALIGDAQWSILGQSFGGFCSLNYLSTAPEGLKEVLITGGIPSLARTADDVYRNTYPRVRAKNEAYYARYPDDVARVKLIAKHLIENDVRLPGGARLTARRFLQLGMPFGMSDGYEPLHYWLEEAFVEGASGPEINWNFLKTIEHEQFLETNPIYALLQEGCYTQGVASRWSAERIMHEFPEFDLAADGPLLFTGEMIYPSMFDEFPRLQPLKAAAEILANKQDWPMLYDVARLRENRVPIAAAVYHDDMYVPLEFSEETARVVPNTKLWITNEYEHNGLRADGAVILDRLLKMARGEL